MKLELAELREAEHPADAIVVYRLHIEDLIDYKDADACGDYEAATDPRPKLVAVPEHDQFRSPSSAKPILSSWTNTEVTVVKGADHFLVGRTDKAAELFVSFAQTLSAT